MSRMCDEDINFFFLLQRGILLPVMKYRFPSQQPTQEISPNKTAYSNFRFMEFNSKWRTNYFFVISIVLLLSEFAPDLKVSEINYYFCG